MEQLSTVEQRFVLHWGEMGTRWGINRTVAQVHALLFLAPQPMHAEQIQEILGVARSNVSTSLRELQGWGIVRLVHIPGDRRDHFESLQDVWQMFRVVLDERKKRELDPTLAVLEACLAEAGRDRSIRPTTVERLRSLQAFFVTTTAWYGHLRSWPVEAITRMAKLGDRALKLLGLGG